MKSGTKACRICFDEAGKFISPCRCTGSLKYVHSHCLKKWIQHSNRRICELCRRPYDIQAANNTNAKADRTLFWGLLLCVLAVGLSVALTTVSIKSIKSDHSLLACLGVVTFYYSTRVLEPGVRNIFVDGLL